MCACVYIYTYHVCHRYTITQLCTLTHTCTFTGHYDSNSNASMAWWTWRSCLCCHYHHASTRVCRALLSANCKKCSHIQIICHGANALNLYICI